MGSPISLRDNVDGSALRLLAKQTRDADQGRRLLALSSIYDGGSRCPTASFEIATLTKHQRFMTETEDL